jgi:hypothetical protein
MFDVVDWYFKDSLTLDDIVVEDEATGSRQKQDPLVLLMSLNHLIDDVDVYK